MIWAEPQAWSTRKLPTMGITAEGVLVGRTNRSIPGLNNTINVAPPLIVDRADVDEIVEAVKVGIEQGCKDIRD